MAAAAMTAPGGDLGGRLAEAARAEQALRGPMDGDWTARDDHGRVVFILRIADPRDGPLDGAWRDAKTGEVGQVAGGSRGGGLIHLKLAGPAGERAWLSLHATAAEVWRGRAMIDGRSVALVLTRG